MVAYTRRDCLRGACALLAAASFAPAVWGEARSGMGTLKHAAPGLRKALAQPATAPLRRVLQTFAGQAVLVNFWATWCPPCREEMPVLQKLATHFQGRAFAIQTVAVADRRQEAVDFLWDHAVSLPLLLDPEQDIFKTIGARVLPTSLLLDAHHAPRWQVTGPLDWESPAILAKLEQLIPST